MRQAFEQSVFLDRNGLDRNSDRPETVIVTIYHRRNHTTLSLQEFRRDYDSERTESDQCST